MSPTEASALDLDLKARLVRRERAAAEAFVAEHLERVFQFVHYRVGRDAARAEDVVQETFCVALRDIERFDGRSSLEAWLRGIARNTLRAERRKARPVSLEEALERADPEIDAILAEVAREPLPDHVLEARETRDLVGATLASLPRDYQEALIGKYVEGLTTARLAERSRKSAKAAESTLTRARAAFARVFELLARRRGGTA